MRESLEKMLAKGVDNPLLRFGLGKAIEDIALPPGTTIGAIIRDEQVLIAHDDTVIEAGDHVILFVVDKKHIRDVEKLFHVGLSFF